MMRITFGEPTLPKKGTLVLFSGDGPVLSATARAVDKDTGGAIKRAIASSRFKGKKGQTLVVSAPHNSPYSRIVLGGVGKPSDVTPLVMESLGGKLYAVLEKTSETDVHIALDPAKAIRLPGAEMAAHLAYGIRLKSYRFDKYRTKEKPEDKPGIARVAIGIKGAASARKVYASLDKIADGVFWTRDFVSEPANVLYPESYANEIRSLSKLGVKVELLDEAKMKKLGMGSLLGVAQGSVRKPFLVVMRWNGAPGSKEKPVAFIGKGVTFDTGGISLKPAAGMEDMKYDMGGSGAVVGLMKALAGRKAKVNAVGVVGLVENMPGGNAQRPGDVVTSMSGQTIEVINTDAEGRLVLADALWYTQDRFKPKFMINLATLTGAIIISLAHEYAGLFSNNDELCKKLTAAGEAEGEKLWRMPMGEVYDKQLKSDIADMKNVGNRDGGSITAAQFLQRFVNDVPWAHLDIAGTAWTKTELDTVPKGATGFGVRLLNRLVADNYEAK
jgi:leucyl aminopeptidase